MSQSLFLTRFRSLARTCFDLLVRPTLCTIPSNKKRLRRHSILLEITPLEDRTLLSNVLSYGIPDLNETVLTRANVSPATFGKIFTTAVDEASRAQPLYVSGVNIPGQGLRNVVYVVTENDSLYAIDANSGQVLWQDSFINPSTGLTAVPGTDFGSTGNFGIRGTPVVNPDTGTIFVVTFTRQTSGAVYDYAYKLWDLNLTDGQNALAPVTIGDATDIPGEAGWASNWTVISGPSVQGAGAGSVNGTITFNACAQVQTAALTVANGSVFVEFSGLVENFSDQYHGWLLGYNAQNLQPTAVWNATPNGAEGGIWMGGNPVSVDAAGNLYLAVGNGDFANTENGAVGPELNANGFPANGNYGESIVKLVVDPTTSAGNQNTNGWGLAVADYFTPFNQPALNAVDMDIGSTAPLLLPDAAGSAAHPHLIMETGKGPTTYLIDRDNMGKYDPNTDHVVQEFQTALPPNQDNQMASSVYFNGTVYKTGNVQVASAYSLADDQLTLTSQSANEFGYSGADPTISANGVGNGIVWELDYGSNQLFAYDASNLTNKLWASNQAPNNRDSFTYWISQFNAPTLANGMAYVITTGQFIAYGLLYTTPSAPTTLTATTAAGTTEIDLSWTNPSTTETGTKIQRSLDGVNFTTIATVAVTPSTYHDMSVAANTTYFYQVVATNQGVDSEPSNQTSATTAATAGTAPLAASGLTAVAVAGGPAFMPQVNLSWTDNNPGNESAFLIERSVNGGTFVLLQQVPATQTTYSDLKLSSGAYSYMILSSNAAANSGPSVSASASVPTIPVAPTQGQGVVVSSGAINLSWQDNSNNESSFQIFRRVGIVGNYTLIATLPPNTTSYQDSGLSPGTLYNYQITAYNISGHLGFTSASASTRATPSASLAGTNSTTLGNWQGNFGVDGYNVIGGTASYPSYAQVSVTGNSFYTWAASTTDLRALQQGASRIAATWYTANSVTIHVALNDPLSHQVSLYLVDFDGNNSRSERIDVLNVETGAVLDSQTVSNFTVGEYLTWTLSGDVAFRITRLLGSNAVVSGLFFGGAAPTAALLATDTTTQGSWLGVYGADGANVIGSTANYPAYAQVNAIGNSTEIWAASTADVRALQQPTGTGRIAACWFSAMTGVPDTYFTIDVALTDGRAHQVSLYLFDFEGLNIRNQRIDVLNAQTGAVLDSQAISNFSSGIYLTWNLKGHVQFRVMNLASNAVVSGIFFGGATTSATILAADATTEGTWQGVYGSDGENVIGTAASYPAYAQVSVTGNSSFTWATSTSDIRALQQPVGGGRIAATWYSSSSFTVDVNLTDNQPHQVALYLLDWDSNNSRSERIDVLNAQTGAVLDSRIVSSFSGGQYLVWSLNGHVQFRFTVLQGVNAVLSGLLFGRTSALVDTTTQGNWLGWYGADGYNVIGDSAIYPAYAQVSTSGNSTTTWTGSTSDVRALQRMSSGRVAACWYGSTFSVDINLTDGQGHQIGLYLLDWDGNNSRSERIDVVDVATGAVLDSKTVSAFSGGTYLTWNLQGHVQFRFTRLQGSNAVLSGFFFGRLKPQVVDTTTQGNWLGTYGGDGYNVIGDSASYPSYAQVSTVGNSAFTWTSSTTDVRAPQTASGSGRVAGCWYGSTFTLDVNLTDGQSHLVELYLLDWDGNNSRSQRIDVLDVATGAVLDSRTVSAFSSGQYLAWSLKGHVQFRFTVTQGANAVLSGLFFGRLKPPVIDTATQGNWKGKYGADGYNVIGDSTNYPAYAQVSAVGNSANTWNGSTSDVRALQRAGSGRIAGSWYGSSFTVDVNLIDGQAHQVGLYLLDWDGNNARSERIDVLDAVTGALLDSRTVSSFSAGEYLTWSLKGHELFRFASLQGANAVLSGIFFDPAS
jgi:hypothetical protein